MATKILVPLDFLVGCERVLGWAADLAQQVGGQLLVLHVVPRPHQLDPFFKPGKTPPETVAFIRQQAAQRLDRLLRGREVTHRLDVAEGEPAAAILAAAKRLGVDLIVVGAHQKGVMARAFLGSVAEKVIRHSAVPVVTVRHRSAT